MSTTLKIETLNVSLARFITDALHGGFDVKQFDDILRIANANGVGVVARLKESKIGLRLYVAYRLDTGAVYHSVHEMRDALGVSYDEYELAMQRRIEAMETAGI